VTLGLTRRQFAVLGALAATFLVLVAWCFVLGFANVASPGTFLLAAGALAANLADARWDSKLSVSGSLVAGTMAAAFLGPVPGFVVVVIAEVGAWAAEAGRRSIGLGVNLVGIGGPVLATGVLLSAIVPGGASAGIVFYLALGGLIAVASATNLLVVSTGLVIHDRGSFRPYYEAGRELLFVWLLNIGLAVVIASLYVEVGLVAVLLFALASLGFTYQSRLVVRAEDRSRKYASLSWGVLSGMLRSLDMRDGRTARHSAAVAQFARDIAAESGLSEGDQELAHTAGLLHDVGKFALSDRALDHGVKLNEEDWKGIRRHPELGADMLKDLGLYGPIADVVRSHHERLDGRGYPAGLADGEIPEVAKIVAVAEVYDTLTGGDTYRAPMSSFQALRELRRVVGRQLDGRYVEALAAVLEGTGVDYRHAEEADFDQELALERRVGDAVREQGSAG
jgi:putative nucleotidyltransferase with HDIG domain